MNNEDKIYLYVSLAIWANILICLLAVLLNLCGV